MPEVTLEVTEVPSKRPARSDVLIALLIAGAVSLLVLLLAGGVPGVPMNDDFSYARTAEAFARTGRITYNGWATAMLGAQVLLGGLVIKIAGFSYAVLDAVGLACASAAAGAAFLLFRALGSSRAVAGVATALLTLNPTFLGAAPTFLTEPPSLLLYVLSLLLLARSLRPDAGGAARLTVVGAPFAASAALGVFAGTDRQLLWAAYLAALLGVVPFVERREVTRRLLPAAAAVIAVGGALTLWFARQPYSVAADPSAGLQMLQQAPLIAFLWVYKFFCLLGALLLPLCACALLRRGRPLRLLYLVAFFALALLPLLALWGPANLGAELRLTVYGQYLTDAGTLVGGVHGFERRPSFLTAPLPGFVYLAGAVGWGLSLYLFFEWLEDMGAARRTPERDGDLAVTAGVTAAALGAAAQALLSLPWYLGGNVFDRYHLLLLPGLLALHGRQASLALAGGLAPFARLRFGLAAAGAVVLSLLGVVVAQEYFAYTRARTALYSRLLAQGVPPTAIDGGLEMSGDAQVVAEGHLNEARVRIPADAHDPERRGNVTYRPDLFPAIDAGYLISTDPPPPDLRRAQTRDPLAAEAEPVDSLTYGSWIPPTERTMYVYRLREEE